MERTIRTLFRSPPGSHHLVQVVLGDLSAVARVSEVTHVTEEAAPRRFIQSSDQRVGLEHADE